MQLSTRHARSTLTTTGGATTPKSVPSRRSAARGPTRGSRRASSTVDATSSRPATGCVPAPKPRTPLNEKIVRLTAQPIPGPPEPRSGPGERGPDEDRTHYKDHERRRNRCHESRSVGGVGIELLDAWCAAEVGPADARLDERRAAESCGHLHVRHDRHYRAGQGEPSGAAGGEEDSRGHHAEDRESCPADAGTRWLSRNSPVVMYRA